MKKKYIIINLTLFILIILVGIKCYKTFKNVNRNDDSETKTSQYVYICEEYGEKYYSENKIKGVKCHKTSLNCSDCKIETSYFENKIVYRNSKKNIVIYDLKNKKIIETINDNSHDYWAIDFYEQDNATYGFSYKNKNYENVFYNLNNGKKFNLGEKSDLCFNVNKENYSYNCEFRSDDKNFIRNDRIIVEKTNLSDNEYVNYYGILNLKTGEYDIPVKYELIKYNVRYILDENDEIIEKDYYIVYDDDKRNGITYTINMLYNEDLKLVYENKDTTKSYLVEQYFDKDILLLSNYSDYYLSRENGNIYENSQLLDDTIKTKIYNKIENNDLKEKTDKYQISIEPNFSYSSETKTIYADFSFNDSYYETFISIHYKFDLKTNMWEEYDEQYCEDCGEE